MAWGYWSATTVSDRGRSPRKNQNGNSQIGTSSSSTSSSAANRLEAPQQHHATSALSVQNSQLAAASSAVIPAAKSYQIEVPSASSGHHFQHYQHQYETATNPPTSYSNSSNNNGHVHQHCEEIGHNHHDFDDLPPVVFSRRSSLDLSVSGQVMIHHHNNAHATSSAVGQQMQQSGHVCAAHGSRHNISCGGGGGNGPGTLSAGNTLTRLGSRHTAVEYAVPHHFHIHRGTAYVEYHQPQLSFSDDDSSSEPGYATVFPNVPPQPGMPCQGEDRSIYRRGARRWRKLYRVNGHIFQAKRFNRRAFCAFCHDRIWGLGRQGFKCIQCKLLVHKKCHKLVQLPCANEHGETLLRTDQNGGESQQVGGLISPPPPLIGSGDNLQDLRDYSDQPQTDLTGESVPVEDPKEDLDNGGSTRQYSLNDFELIRVIGRGSYAKVLMVELKKTKRIYAMKVIKKALVTDDEDIDWVQTEKHVFETASNHPFLVGLHSCFQTPSRLFFVIEFVRGGDLMFHMQQQRKLFEEHARFYAAEISLALNFLHCKGIIYRDLKLDNVLLDHEGHIKLTDYGMCKEGIRPGDTTSTFCGTPNYIAPEILRGEEYGFSVDWWALGVLLYEMLAGRSPFDIAGASENPDLNTEDYLFQVILHKTIRIPRSLSVKAANVLKGFLNKNPADRLGCHSPDSFVEIMSHQFFKSIDWDMLEQKLVPPPFKPKLNSDRDLGNFPPEFTDEPVRLTPDDPRVIEKIDQSEFEGFEYVNPLLMSLEDCV